MSRIDRPPGSAAATTVRSADDILAALDDEQREVALATTGPVCVLAGAGTGKTRAITHRIAYGVRSGVYVPHQVLAVTFTARAAGQMRSRLRDLGVAGVQARTFHAAALRQLGYFWPRAIGGAPPSLIEHKAPVVAEAATRLAIRLDRPEVRDLAAEIEWAKVALLTPHTYPAAASAAGRPAPAGLDQATTARLLELYEQVKTERGVIDFEDVLLITAGLLEQHDEVAVAVRSQYRHFVVDEYQDVSALQQRLLDAWTGGRDDICVVGDPNQTIYSFTGASADHLLGFRARHPHARLVRLVRDYRSTPQVVALANALAATMPSGGPAGPLSSGAQAGAQAGARAGASAGASAGATVGAPGDGGARPGRIEALRLLAQRASGPVPTLRAHADDVEEAAQVAGEAASLIAGGLPASEIAVLYRTNAQSEVVEQALSDAGVPYLVRGGERFFARREVRDAVLLLRGAARAAAMIGTGRDGPADRGEPADLPRQTRDVLTSAGWSVDPPAGPGAVRERWESLQALASLADGLAAQNPDATLTELVADLDERSAAQHAPTVQGVTLASLHAAKGLEWDAVFLIGLSEGLVPIALASGWEAIAEERRLLYVGITRARERLALSWARARTPGGRAGRALSRFVDEARVRAALDGAVPGAGPGTEADGRPRTGKSDGPSPAGRVRRSRLASTCRTCAGVLETAAERKVGRCASCPPTYDEALLDRLRAWRSEAAGRAKVPPYAVLTDATLIAIAESLPDRPEALARVPGVGPAKLARYGEAVLTLLREA
ncbi:MAG: ATP-dependent DNA helicase UvrD2 [Kineosporiaceae bacterium]|nr:ATP-dependent DNA helicase UvrD2 [Kineosporiaceae bacterium]